MFSDHSLCKSATHIAPGTTFFVVTPAGRSTPPVFFNLPPRLLKKPPGLKTAVFASLHALRKVVKGLIEARKGQLGSVLGLGSGNLN
ncbi:MAG: hypothetical protein C0507_01885 [Cyanobacteria bacterium PR.3.49]|nr:hypothetical protein [Cyanobacteria bacterium PR.3.49]